MERRRVVYSGRVQGVGFRYTTTSIARRYPISGYVQNLRDGSVVVEAEGTGVDLDRFLAELESTMGDNIRDTRAETLVATGLYTDFRVKF
jgi:acylphosphatase